MSNYFEFFAGCVGSEDDVWFEAVDLYERHCGVLNKLNFKIHWNTSAIKLRNSSTSRRPFLSISYVWKRARNSSVL
jgi:hypothetical protein